MTNIPNDSYMLLSFINLKLRDYYPSLSELCEDLQLDQTELKEKLSKIDYFYDEKLNIFI